MVRAPCCEKMGLKRGPWTTEEDKILISYIQKHGHGNWRALPKQAGLLRCGKSCRLRWINYLRPDIKRGNFTREEEDTIIQLHQMLGNKWSAIAARLPGRTDNEIKNVWHTHLKKKLKQNDNIHQTKRHSSVEARPGSPPQCSSSGISSVTTTTSDENNKINNGTISTKSDSLGSFAEIDDSFWSEVLSAENNSEVANYEFSSVSCVDPQVLDFPFSPLITSEELPVHDFSTTSNMYQEDVDFWYNMFTRPGELLPELSSL
ncbi:hypothetical protein UlMin_031638 [Ulmus minor]